MVVELVRRSDNPAAKLKKITAWLDSRLDVQSWRTGEAFDPWYWDFQHVEDKIEQEKERSCA